MVASLTVNVPVFRRSRSFWLEPQSSSLLCVWKKLDCWTQGNEFSYYTTASADWPKSDSIKLDIISSRRWCVVSGRCIQARAAAHELRLLHFTWWQQQSEISGASTAVMMKACARLFFRMKNDAVWNQPTMLHHSIRGRLFYLKVSLLMNTQLIHWVEKKGRGGGQKWGSLFIYLFITFLLPTWQQRHGPQAWGTLCSLLPTQPWRTCMRMWPLQIKGPTSTVIASPTQNLSIAAVDMHCIARRLL